MSFAAPTPLVWLAAAVLTVTTLWVLAGTVTATISAVRRGAACTANVLAALALFTLMVQPSFPPDAQQKVVLATPPAQAGSALLRSSDTVQLDSLDLFPLFEQVPRPELVKVVGAGLPLAAWTREGLSLDLALKPLPPGLTAMNWQRRLAWGDQLTVSGRVVGYDDPVRLGLEYEGVTVAEITTGDGFVLRHVPRFAGLHQYALVAHSGSGRELFREIVPTEVLLPPGLDIMVLLSAPSFEARALQRWLAQSAAGLRSETTIAPSIIREQVTGEAPAASAWIEQPDSVDLLVTDPGWLNTLSPYESRQLGNAVYAGLGVLVLADESLPGKVPLLLDGWRWRADDGIEVSIANDVAVRSVGVSVNAAQVLVQGDDGRTLVAAAPRGAGNVAVSLIDDSHALRRRSGGEAYARLWQPVIAATARATASPLWVQAPLPAVQAGEWVWLCRPDGCQRRVLEAAGWQPMVWEGDRLWVYAHATGDWSTWRAAALAEDTRMAARLMAPDQGAGRVAGQFQPSGWLLLFFLSAAFLWLEQRAR